MTTKMRMLVLHVCQPILVALGRLALALAIVCAGAYWLLACLELGLLRWSAL